MTRPVIALLVLALLATVAGGAQCVVRCASPVAPPPCHHHSHGKPTPAPQACSAGMLPAEARADTAVPVVIPVAVGPTTEMTAAPVVVVGHPIETAAVLRHTVLRI